MATIHLTDAAWFAREYARVRAVLTYNLPRTGIEASELSRRMQDYLGVTYTTAELSAFCDQLVTDGVIRIEA